MTRRVDTIKGSVRAAVFTPLKRLLNCLDPPVLVLLYHRVTALSSDPEMLAVSPGNFRAHLSYLKDNFPIVRFEDDWTKVSRPAVVITFDDGYADNALEALPLLEEAGVPATFFVSTGTIGSGAEFWWHELEHIILEQQSPPPNFTLEDSSCGRSWQTGSPGEKQLFYHDIMRLMNDVDAERRHLWLKQLRHWSQTEAGSVAKHRAMTVEELRLLAESGQVTIGAHTVSHTRLASLSAGAQREEITTSKAELETWLGRQISVFSYPFGRRCDYSDQTVAICREAGFTKAAANFAGQAHRWTDPFHIPRHLVRNWPVETFAEKLRGFWTR